MILTVAPTRLDFDATTLLGGRTTPALRRLVFTKARTAPTFAGIHPGAVALALGGYGVFLGASWAGWAVGYTALLITVMYGLSLMYFGLLVGMARSSSISRGDDAPRSFRQFLDGKVETLTGWVNGRDALVQIAFMPLALGLAMSFFAVVWLCISG